MEPKMKTTGMIAQEVDDILKATVTTSSGAVGAIDPFALGPLGAGANGTWIAGNGSISQKDQLIQGRMIKAEIKIYDSALALPVMDKDAIRKKLAEDLVDQLLRSEFVEYTQQKMILEECVAIRARLFAVPNGDIKILKEKGYD